MQGNPLAVLVAAAMIDECERAAKQEGRLRGPSDGLGQIREKLDALAVKVGYLEPDDDVRLAVFSLGGAVLRFAMEYGRER